MISGQDAKYVASVPPAAIADDASFTATAIDTLNYDYCEVIVALGATDIAMAALQVKECATSGGSYAEITGLVAGTSDNIEGDTSALPTATDDNGLFVFQIDLRNRKRYLKLVATAGDGTNGTYLASVARLSRGRETPSTSTLAGCTDVLRI